MQFLLWCFGTAMVDSMIACNIAYDLWLHIVTNWSLCLKIFWSFSIVL